ncbi:MAG: hypothetical protein AB7Q01_14100 [Gammaproteobacteria bacterium]
MRNSNAMQKPAGPPLDWMGTRSQDGYADVPMPALGAERVLRFLFDKRTGNVVLNIKDGEILKVILEEHVRI